MPSIVSVTILGHAVFNVVTMMGSWTYYSFVADPTLLSHFYRYAAATTEVVQQSRATRNLP
jgi:hypothetical protein